MLSTAGLVPVAQEFANASSSGALGSEWNPVIPEWPIATTPTGWPGSAVLVVDDVPVDPDGRAPRSVTAGVPLAQAATTVARTATASPRHTVDEGCSTRSSRWAGLPAPRG